MKIYISILLSTFTFYYGSTKYGFSQDDWYFLLISEPKNLKDFLNFFNPWSQSGFAFYRPVGTQLYYFIFNLLFKNNNAPIFMHFFMIIMQSLAGYQVYLLVNKLTKSKITSLLTSILYSTSSVHFLSLYYIAATQQLLATLFSLLSINNFLNRRLAKSSMYFILSLMCKEVALITPAIMVLADQRINSGRLVEVKKIILNMLPIIGVTLIYLIIKYFSMSDIQSEYHFIFNGSVIGNIRWYYLFGYGIPEELVHYGMPRLGVNWVRFINDHGLTGFFLIIAPFSFACYVLARSIRSILRKDKLKYQSTTIYFVWWITSLLPVIFLSNHRYPHYVDIALIPLLLLAIESQKKNIAFAFTTILVLVSYTNIKFSENVHWTTKRANLSNEISKNILTDVNCKNPSGIIFAGNNQELREISYALSNANGPRVICNNPNLIVKYPGILE